MPYKIKFGTDGWRGVIAEDYTLITSVAARRGSPIICWTKAKKGNLSLWGMTNVLPQRTLRPR